MFWWWGERRRNTLFWHGAVRLCHRGKGGKKKTNPQARAPSETKRGKRKRQRNTTDFGLQQQHVHPDERCKGSGWDFAEDRVCAQGFIWAARSLKGGMGLSNAFASLLQIRSTQFAPQQRVIWLYFAQSRFYWLVWTESWHWLYVFACVPFPSNWMNLVWRKQWHTSWKRCVCMSGIFFLHWNIFAPLKLYCWRKMTPWLELRPQTRSPCSRGAQRASARLGRRVSHASALLSQTSSGMLQEPTPRLWSLCRPLSLVSSPSTPSRHRGTAKGGNKCPVASAASQICMTKKLSFLIGGKPPIFICSNVFFQIQ